MTMPENGAPRDWDGAAYDRVADPMARWGASVLDRLPLAGDETVLDAGCGSGRVTEQLAERVPRGHVIALDGSPSMVEAARGRLARFGDRVSFLVADLGAPLPIVPSSVDAILSTATFHWVRDHDALFHGLATVMRPGARLVAQCGGAGNIAGVRAAIAAAGEPWEGPWTFATPDETRARLEAAGFIEVEAWLHDEPTQLEPGEPLRDYLRTVVLGAHLERRAPGNSPEAFVDAVAAGLGEPRIDYVRLNILATRR
ncbi:MAG TPA: methyltransferase domain-containing protein [Candidatus Limnocylindrales bacterium]|nr:methyltransferase domain-containing protein [Candidatus Limnocylindrales bacterium]